MNPNLWKIGTLILGGVLLAGAGFFVSRFIYTTPSPSNNVNTNIAYVVANKQWGDENANQNPGSNYRRPNDKETYRTLEAATGVLDIQAAVIYKMGGVQPVARETFYLLDSDLESVLRSAGLKADGGVGVIGRFGLAVQYPDQNAKFYNSAMAAVRRHVKYTITTDFEGKGSFQNVSQGQYFLFGMSNTRGGFAIWNLQTNIAAGRGSLILDQKNAAVAF